MKVFSAFSGVEGFCQKFKDAEFVGFSEIDKYANQVLKYHYPEVKNYGDISKIDYGQVPDFDLLTGGSPCQDFSIAGKRAGIVGQRSGLVWEYIRCLQEKQPRYFIWENVKGVMSSRGGWDFANILTAFSEAGYSLWWQVLNAKDFGVPQNRERVFVCGFREGSPKEVFFEPKSDGIFETEAERESGSRQGLWSEISPTIDSRYGALRNSGEPYIIGWSKSHRTGKSEADKKRKNYGEIEQRVKIGEANTLSAGDGGGDQSTKNFVVYPRFDGRDGRKTLKSGRTPEIKIIPTIRAEHHNTADVHFIPEGATLRRLMPIETERLMGWADDWTRWGIDNKGNKVEISDSQRYKMCGNGVVSNVSQAIYETLISP